jgi:hypothetical protein
MIANGDCYARTASATANNLTENGTLMSPGTVTTHNNITYHGNIWAGGAVTVGNNTTITGYVTSATSSVHLNQNAQVLGNAMAGTSITLDNGASVAGVQCPASPSAPGCPTNTPPTLQMPSLKCAASNVGCWTSLYPSLVSTTTAGLNALLVTNKNALTGTYYVSDGGTIDFTGGGTVTGPLTIITNGKVSLSRDLVTPSATTAPAACTGGGTTTCEVVILSTNTASDAIHIYAPRFTATPATLSVLLYTLGTIQDDSGANPVTFSGSVYGGSLTIDSNGTTVTQSPDLVAYPPPFVDWTLSSSVQYTVEPVAWRELAPAQPS